MLVALAEIFEVLAAINSASRASSASARVLSAAIAVVNAFN
jgi:hypothetical protein